jgi:hypothetical protein
MAGKKKKEKKEEVIRLTAFSTNLAPKFVFGNNAILDVWNDLDDIEIMRWRRHYACAARGSWMTRGEYVGQNRYAVPLA